MSEPQLTAAMIRDLATDQSFSRGEDYYRTGAVWGVERRGDVLLADVMGSSYEPYQVNVELGAGGVVDAYCSCPYDWGGYCKHIVAVLLTYLHEPETITERPAVTDLLEGLEQDDLADLLSGLLETNPQLMDWVEGQVAAIKQAPAQTAPETETAPRQHRAPIDPAPFRRQAHAIMSSLRGMRPSEAYWHTDGMVNQLGELVQQAQPFLQAGDGRNALLILEAVTKVYVDRWIEFDDSDGYLSGFFSKLGAAVAEAILTADLSEQERDDWANRLTAWQGELDDYGIEDGFNVAIAAAVQGWDYAPLQRVLQEGQITQQGAWEDKAPWYADELAVIRLNVLENQGRTQEYLRLAEAEGQTARYVTMLVKLGQGQEAVAYGLQYLSHTGEALALAQSLREHDLRQQALQIAEHGLTLYGDNRTLARWLRDFAADDGQDELALRAARAAFNTSTSLADYQAVQSLAGAEWPQIKAELLKHLASQGYAGQVDIYLYEGMVDEAVQTMNKGIHGYNTLERVVDAAYESHPDWVIAQCKAQAERIMGAGKSKYYHHAVRWLGKARRAYLAAGRDEQWSAYLEGLISKHTRKYALRPRLEELRK